MNYVLAHLFYAVDAHLGPLRGTSSPQCRPLSAKTRWKPWNKRSST